MREMKDSGIQCIDKILASWKITKLKYISNSIFRGQGITKEDVNINGDIQCVRYGEIYSKYSNSFSQCYSFINSNNLSPKQPFIKNGDIILAITGELIEEIGKNILYTGKLDCAVGGDIVVVRLGIDADNRFINYALNSSYCQNQKSCNKFKLKVVHISSFEIGNILVLIPPLSIQKCIADFLDQKCSEIDDLTTDIQTQIETLEEYKKSLITEAVTKGLDPNVEMKDSGIQWVDKIPVSWKISKIKYISNSIFKGQGIKKEDVDIRGNIQCVRYGEIYSKYSNSFSQCFSFINSNNLHPKQPFIKNGDIIFAITGELIEEIGKNILYTGELDCAVGGDIVVARIDEDRRFVNYALNSSYCQNQKSCNKFKLKVVHISAFEIGNIIVLLPPLTDQKCIADFLDQKCSEIDQTISEKKQQLETLAEYKKSLIYECVTGKKEIA